jgi:hypothetical protein
MQMSDLKELVNVNSVGAQADILRKDGNLHPNIRDVELAILAWIKSVGDEESIDPAFYGLLTAEVTQSFRRLRVWFYKQDVIVVPYNHSYHTHKYPKPETKFQARSFLTGGKGHSIYGILFITDLDDIMNLAYNDREDIKEKNKRAMNNGRNILGIEQDLISKAVTNDRVKGHLERSKAHIDHDIKRFQSYK